VSDWLFSSFLLDGKVFGLAKNSVNIGFVTLVSSVAAVGGLLFGYDTAVVSGAIGFLGEHFHLSPAMTGWTVSSLLIGAMIGSGLSGVASDRVGRKKILLLAALLFTIASIGSAIPTTITQLIWARMLGGVGIGIASSLSPIYIAEIAPASIRGRLVSLNQLAIVIGISAVYFINASVAARGTAEWNLNTGWRYMFAVGVVPGLLFLILLFVVPESPRWLTKQGRVDEAEKILARVNGPEQAKAELEEIRHSITAESGRVSELLSPAMKRPLFVGIALAVLQQVTGINAIMYYAPEIFKNIGAGENSSFYQTVLVGLVNLVFTFLAIWLIDRVGRKRLLLVGTVLMSLCLLVVGTAFQTGHTAGSWVLVAILLYVASFAVSFGPVMWVVLSEIFPTRVRGVAMSVATVALWAADYLVSQTFPILIESIGPGMTFYLFLLMSVIAFFFTLRSVPETKGKTLEQIEQSWT
jgi:MFS transporter, SP family, arabinose:H+ symporter